MPFLEDAKTLLGSEWFRTLVLGIGALAAWLTLRKNVRVRRAEWLFDLYKQFYDETSPLAGIRRILDSPERDDFLKGIEKDSAAEERLVNYLNFFEFLGSLRRLRQLKRKEVRFMFEYYVQNLAKHRTPNLPDSGELLKYCKNEGFENVLWLIDDLAVRR